MARQELRDSSGRLLGWRQQVGNRIEGRHYNGFLAGWYDPKQDETYDRTGKRIGRGDILSSLITMPS